MRCSGHGRTRGFEGGWCWAAGPLSFGVRRAEGANGMLPLDSPRWAVLRASPGGTGDLAARLLRDGPAADFGELLHQACHQFTVGEVAYAIVPHAVALAGMLPPVGRAGPLAIAGVVAACRAAYPGRVPPVPGDLRADFERAIADARPLAADALGQAGWGPQQGLELLATVAGLQGRGELALHLFGCEAGGELACPSCGERLRVGSSRTAEPGAAADPAACGGPGVGVSERPGR